MCSVYGHLLGKRTFPAFPIGSLTPEVREPLLFRIASPSCMVLQLQCKHQSFLTHETAFAIPGCRLMGPDRLQSNSLMCCPLSYFSLLFKPHIETTFSKKASLPTQTHSVSSLSTSAPGRFPQPHTAPFCCPATPLTSRRQNGVLLSSPRARA